MASTGAKVVAAERALLLQVDVAGLQMEDPSDLFNASLEGNTRRAIDFHAGDKIDGKALKALIRAAVALNTPKASQQTLPR